MMHSGRVLTLARAPPTGLPSRPFPSGGRRAKLTQPIMMASPQPAAEGEAAGRGGQQQQDNTPLSRAGQAPQPPAPGPGAAMDGGAAYVAQLNAVCQFLRAEGFLEAEKQLLSELEQRYPSLSSRASSSNSSGEAADEDTKARQAQAQQETGQTLAQAIAAAAAATQAAEAGLAAGTQQQQSTQQQDRLSNMHTSMPLPPRQPPSIRKPQHRILKQKVPWGPEVDEYQNIEDVGYIRKDISGQQQFEELELMGSEFASEREENTSAMGGLSHVEDEEDDASTTPASAEGYAEASSSGGEEGEGEAGAAAGEGDERPEGDVASLSETEDLGKPGRTSGFQSPASSTLDLIPSAAAAAAADAASPSLLGASSDPAWDMGPQDIKLTEPVSVSPSKGSVDQGPAGEDPKPVLSRVESLSSSLKDFDTERMHEATEGMASGHVSRAHSEGGGKQSPPLPEPGTGEVIDFNPIPLAEATPQDLVAFGLQDQQQQSTAAGGSKAAGSSKSTPQPEASSSVAAAAAAGTESTAAAATSASQPASAQPAPEAGAASTAAAEGSSPSNNNDSAAAPPAAQASAEEQQDNKSHSPDAQREAGGGFSFPVTPKQSDEPQSHPPPFKSWPSVRSSFTSDFAAASDDDHNAADYADEDYSKSVSASKSGSRSTSQNLGAHMRKLDLNHHTDEDASAGGATGPDQWKGQPKQRQQQQQFEAEGHNSGPQLSSSGNNCEGPNLFSGAMRIGGVSPDTSAPAPLHPTGSLADMVGEEEGSRGGPTKAEAGANDEDTELTAAARKEAEESWFQGGSRLDHSLSGADSGSAVPSRSPAMVLAASASDASDGSHYGSPRDASESAQSAGQLTLAPSPFEDHYDGAGPDIQAHMVDPSYSSTSSQPAVDWEGGGDEVTSSVTRRQVPRSGTESGPDDTEMREAEADQEAQELHWQQAQLSAQQEAASQVTPPCTTDENGMLVYQYDEEYIAKSYEIFDLRVFHRRCHTGFEETKDFPIRMNDLIAGRYQVMDFLGSAAFSRAIQALDIKTGMLVCLKIIKNNKDYFDQSLDEIKLLKFTNSYDPEDKHNIVRLYDFFYYKEHLFLVCELLRANLYEFQKYNRESGDAPYFTNACIQRIARQVLGSLEFLHSLGLIHSDLKPENILIKSYSRCEVKVIDLGSSCFTTDQLSSYVQSRSYRAPEVILGLPYDQKVDVWSLGCILAELSSGQVLFQNDSLATLLARLEGILGPVPEWMVQKGRYSSRFYTRSGCLYERNPTTDRYEMLIPKRTTLSHRVPDAHKGLVDFISYLLLVDPAKRPTAAEALQHPFMQEDYYS